MYKLKVCFLFLGFAGLIVSCENTEADLLSYEVPQQALATTIDHESMSIEVLFPNNIKSAKDLCSDFQLSDGADAFVDNIIQISGESKNNYEIPFALTVVSEDEILSKTWQINSLNNDYTLEWGLGGFIQKELSLNRSYEWYIDQAQTGIYSDWNCAPSCVVMASRWQKNDFIYTVEDARQMFHPSGGGWYTEDIDSCLTNFNIEHDIIALSDYREETTQILLDQINNGNLILLAIDVHYLSVTYVATDRVDKYYSTIKLGTGHCVVVKGYKQVDGIVYFEVYDPIGYDYKYSDGSFKGKNRYYSSNNIYTAAFATWNYAFVIGGQNGKKTFRRTVKASEIPNIQIL